MYKEMDIADFIIVNANKQGHPVNNIMLQKTLFYLNAEYLRIKNTPLIEDHTFEKWSYGPVLPEIYKEYEKFGPSVITEPEQHIVDYEMTDNKIVYKYDKFDEDNISKDDKLFIEQFIKNIITMDKWDLIEFSHQDPQWIDKEDPFYSNDKTKKYFSKSENRFWEG